jgi:threonine dehydrogenase-like Zn-dependent dehydrogenase
MPSVVRFSAPLTVEVADEPERPLAPHEVRLRTLYSGISAGTELTAYRGTNPYMNKRWDEERRLFVPGETSLRYPVDGWGYEEVGEVVELGSEVESPALGQVVWGTWGHRSGTVTSAEYAAARVLPPSVDPLLGIFSQIGAIALNGVLDADIHVGETVAVFGLGVPGQIVAQLARLNGGRVIGVDTMPARMKLAGELGADHVMDAREGSVAEKIRELTGGRGADVSIEVSGHYLALQEAIKATAYSSRVVVAGFFQGDGVGLFLGEEFHHNRIQVVCSQISGLSPALQHRWDGYRLARTVMDLVADDRIKLEELVSQVVPAANAAEAFDMLANSPEQTLQVVLRYGDDTEENK